jgi:PE family
MSFVASLTTTQPETPLAAQFGVDAGSCQAVSARATAVHDLLVEAMGISAGSHAVTETVNAVTVS